MSPTGSRCQISRMGYNIAMNRQKSFSIAPLPDGTFEVLGSINNKDRRLAICAREDDAIAIRDALGYCVERDIV